MNRATRNKFASGTQADKTDGNAAWETAPEIFAKLTEDFGPFDLDLTADASRALCDAWLGPDSPLLPTALRGLWHRHGTNGFSNPPYGDFIPQVLPIAKDEAARGFSSTFLIPLRVTKAFAAHILHGASDLLFCDRRLVFYENGAPRINPETGKPDTALFDSIVVRYRAGIWAEPRVGVWTVPRHGKAPSTRRAARMDVTPSVRSAQLALEVSL